MRTEEQFVKHEKFRLIREISSMLRDAPAAVCHAWQEGWIDIEFFPNGYVVADYILRPPGWYGHRPITLTLAKFRLDVTRWGFICDPTGKNPYFSPTFVDPITKIDLIG